MELKLFFILLIVAIQQVQSISWTPNRKDPKKRHPDRRSNVTGTVKCQRITAYYDGVLRNKNNPDAKLSVQFELHLELDKKENQLVGSIFKWNDNKIPGRGFTWGLNWPGLQLEEPARNDYHFYGSVLLHFNDKRNDDKNYDAYEILGFKEQIKEQFELKNTVGGCTNVATFTTEQIKLDPKYYKFCVCCDDHFNENMCPSIPMNY
ncbi:hypothetical protein M3Y97_01089800 [Aphelenchoides bicaudatus]|nr:hypothetical protein M3Y97_01089800 [Aphelenchoides bicaudatus]